jgi:hypothetical protein
MAVAYRTHRVSAAVRRTRLIERGLMEIRAATLSALEAELVRGACAR